MKSPTKDAPAAEWRAWDNARDAGEAMTHARTRRFKLGACEGVWTVRAHEERIAELADRIIARRAES